MDSLYHSTVLQRPVEEDEEGVRRERMNGASNSNTRPPQPDFRSPYSPTNSHPRPQFNNPYHPPTPAPLPMPTTAHTPGHPASPRTSAAPSAYASEYQPTPRDKPTSNYYDPTSDSGDRRRTENTSWNEAPSHTPQVRDDGDSYENFVTYQIANYSPESRALRLSSSSPRTAEILQRELHFARHVNFSTAVAHLTSSSATDITITTHGFDDFSCDAAQWS